MTFSLAEHSTGNQAELSTYLLTFNLAELSTGLL